MKEATSVLSATVLVARFPRQQNLVLVRIQMSIEFWLLLLLFWVLAVFCFLFIPTADPPRIITHPQGLKDVFPGQLVAFTIQAEGTEPLKYQWQQKPRSGSEGWQDCDMGRFPGSNNFTLTIPSVQKSNEGSYRCTVSNCADSESSDSATLTLGELKYYSYVYVIEHMWSADKV